MTVEAIIGMGEVGCALESVISPAHTRDIEIRSPISVDVLHIAYPWSPQFVRFTRFYERVYQANLVVVHSTVPVNTCDPNGWVHSPVRGRHPHLAESLTTFTKHVGGERASEFPWPHDLETHPLASTTEAGKLWELAQFGIQIRVNQAIYEWCRENDLDPEVVYRRFAETYNEGYRELGDDQFTRPILDYMPGEIGGHCIVPGTKLLDHPLIDLITGGEE